MDISPMPYSLFRKIELSLSQQWEENLWLSIEKAGKEERDLMLEKGQIDKDGALDRLVAKGHQLIDNETNNRAKLYSMSILCKIQCRETIELDATGILRNSSKYIRTAIGWQSETWKQITSTSPGEHFKKYVASLQHQEANRKDRNKTTRAGVKRKLSFTDPCVSQPSQSSAPDYGPNAVEPTTSETEYNSEQQGILQNLQVTKKDIVEIEVYTKGLWDNPRYVMEWKGRLTASRFGEVCKRRINREPHALVTQILYPKHFTNEAVSYGKVKEKVAIAKFASARRVQIDDSGLFVDEQHPYLGASPDELFNTNSIIEVKCLFKVHKDKITLDQAVQNYRKNSNFCLQLNETGELKLKRNHNYYYQ
ncbi:hypothetical protein ILUMI_22930, partial [Ignelater luminosus]